MNHLKNLLLYTGGIEKYDANAKKFLGDPYFIAWCLKLLDKDYQCIAQSMKFVIKPTTT